MEIGESLEQTAIRETYEETGVILHRLDLIKIVSGEDACVVDQNGSKTYYVTAIFKSTRFSGDLRGSFEGSELGFFDLDNLPSPLSISAQGAAQYLKSHL